MNHFKSFLATSLALAMIIPVLTMTNKQSTQPISMEPVEKNVPTVHLNHESKNISDSEIKNSEDTQRYIPRESSAEMEDGQAIAGLHHMLSELCFLYESTEGFSGWEEEEIITWDTVNGGLRSNKVNSPLLNYIISEGKEQWDLNIYDFPAFSQWGQDLNVSFHIVQKPQDYSSKVWYGVDRNCIIYAPQQEVSELSYCPSDNVGNMVYDSTIWDELGLTLPTDLELYGNDLWPDGDGAETMYEYFAFHQDITLFTLVFDECFPLLFAEKGSISVGDSLTWTIDRENPSAFFVHQQKGNTLQEAVDSVLLEWQYKAYHFPSASEIFETVDVTLEVAQSEDGTLFFFTKDPFLSTSLYLPINDNGEYERIDIEKEWMVMIGEDFGEGWWIDQYVNGDMKYDVMLAEELVKMAISIAELSEISVEGVNITWNSDLPDDSEEPRISVEGGEEDARTFIESELFFFWGEDGSFLPPVESENAKDIPFSFTFLMDEQGNPQILIHDSFWEEHISVLK